MRKKLQISVWILIFWMLVTVFLGIGLKKSQDSLDRKDTQIFQLEEQLSKR